MHIMENPIHYLGEEVVLKKLQELLADVLELSLNLGAVRRDLGGMVGLTLMEMEMEINKASKLEGRRRR